MKTNRTTILFIVLIVLFALVRIPGLHLPYHQDEWKNVSLSSTTDTGGYWAHPPFFQMSFRAAYLVFGQDNFRLFPLIVSLATALLLFAILKKRVNQKAALWSVFIFGICFYNILGSLQPDVDGAIIPFFFLLCLYFYDLFNADSDIFKKRRRLAILVVVTLAGFLVKLNFILVIGVICLDYAIDNWKSFNLKKISVLGIGGIVFGIIYISLLFLIQAVYPAFTIHAMLGHANQFADHLGRNYTQIFVQGIKAIYYLSPLLLVPLLFISKDIFKKTRIFFIYLVFGFIFYFVLFDFSRGALDKYLMFSIVPLAAISASIIATVIGKSRDTSKEIWHKIKVPLLIGLAICAFLLWINFLPHAVVPLYPKNEWFSRALHGRWLMLTPLTGGSGPMGFYVSFLFIVSSYVVSIVLGIVAWAKKDLRPAMLIIFVVIGITYNAVFAEEFLFGKINGSGVEVLHQTVSFVLADESIKSVMSYNDIGNQYLSPVGKYAGRIYAVPEYEDSYREKFANFKGQYMVIDIPHIYENGFYGKFLANCDVLFETKSLSISGRVYQCGAATYTDSVPQLQ